MGNICYRGTGCNSCPHYKYDEERENMACFAKTNEDFGLTKEIIVKELIKYTQKTPLRQ